MMMTMVGLAILGTRSKEFPPGFNGLAKTPPMGWRSWNAFGNRITQRMMLDAAHAISAKNRTSAEEPNAFSLCDVGYCSVGVDEGWENCSGTDPRNGMRQHTAAGLPLIDTNSFPDTKQMVAEIHALGLSAGWYLNGCKCGEHMERHANYVGDIQDLHDFDFDGVKIDGCGAERNQTLYAQRMRESGKNYTIENCHWGRCTDSDDSSCPTLDWCPFNWFRTSGDINAGASSWLANLQTVIRFQDPLQPLSQPGCWAYPDMLEVGRVKAPAPGGFFTWNRAHFGAWCVVSAPLILGLELTDQKLRPILPIISNREAIAVNQAWAGHPGWLADTVYLPPVPFAPGGVVIPSASEADFVLSNGADIRGDHKDAATSGNSAIRSGGPGKTSLVEIGSGLIGYGHRLKAVSLQFRYTAGYTPAAGQVKKASTVSVLLLNCRSKAVVATLLTTPPLGEYSYDHYTGHSPPIKIELDGLEVPNDEALVLALRITNNDRNLQIPIDDLADGFAIRVAWEEGKPTKQRAAVAARAIAIAGVEEDIVSAPFGPHFVRRGGDSAIGAVAESDSDDEAKGRIGQHGDAGRHGRTGLGSVGAAAGLVGAGQLWAKKMPGGGAAALLINHSPHNLSYTLNVSLLNMSKSIWGSYTVRNVWEHEDLPNASRAIYLTVPPFDSKFLRLSP